MIPAMTADVTLREVDRENVRAICDLQLAEGQDRYVAPAAYTVAESAYEPNPFLRAIYADGQPVGVLFVDQEDAVRPRLVRFMVDARHQRAGIGRRAIRLVAEHFTAAGAQELETSYQPGPQEPAGFYALCGFAETGREHGGERVVVLGLSGS
jgi:diamine N-acetyltransferase